MPKPSRYADLLAQIPDTDIIQPTKPTPDNTDPLKQEYWGLREVAERMCWSQDMVKTMRDRMGFPLIVMANTHRQPKVRKTVKDSKRWFHYTNEGLIQNWYIALMKSQREFRKQYGETWWRKKERVKALASGQGYSDV